MSDLFELDIGVLKSAIENGILDTSLIRTQLEMSERMKYLEMHDYKIWQGKNGKWYTKIEGRLIKRNSEKEIQDIVIDFYKNHIPTFYDVFMEWIDFKLYYREIQKQTYDRYIADYNKYIKDSSIDITFNKITETILEKYIRDIIRDLELTAKAWAKIRTVLIGTFKKAYRDKITTIDIRQFLNTLELSPKIFKKRRFTDEESVFTDNEVGLITDYINSVEPSIINYGIILAFQTGLRVGELSALKWSDIKHNYLKVNKTEVRYKDENGNYVYEVRDNAKTDAGDRNVIFLTDADETLKAIRRLNPFGEYVFMRNGERVHSKAFTKKIERICGYVEIIPKSMHKARKTYATKLITGGVDEKVILRQMGHTNIKTTDAFYYFNNKTLEQNRTQIQQALAR